MKSRRYFVGDPPERHLPGQIPSCKTLPLSIRSKPHRSDLLDPLLLIPHFHRASGRTLHLFPGCTKVSVDPLLLVPLAGQSAALRGRSFSASGPSFPHSFRVAIPAGAGSSLWARRPRDHKAFCHGPTFTCALWMMKSRFYTISFRARSPGYEILEFRKHCKRADSCFERFGQHRDPVGALVAEEPRAI